MGWLESQRVVVTGGGSGLGRAITARFVAEGARVVVLDRAADRLHQLAAEFGDRVRTVPGDVTSYADNVRACAVADREFGGLDVFVGNAGIWDFGRTLVDTPAETLSDGFDELFAVNVKGYLLGAKAAEPGLRRSGGTVIFTLSNGSFYPLGGGPLYIAAKHAALGLVRQLAYELAPDIRVNAVAPGVMATDLRGPQAMGLAGQSITGAVPVDRIAEEHTALRVQVRPQDAVGPYVLLASRRESGTVTGAVIDISSMGVPPRPPAPAPFEGEDSIMSITALGYLVVRGPVEQWRRFGTTVLGAQLVDGTTAGEVAFRTDGRAYRLIVQDGPAGPDAMVAIGFETADDAGLTALVERLRAHGVETTEDPALAARRQVTRLVTFTDPVGHLIEVSFGATDASTPFESPTGVRFVSGELGLGHLFVNVTDPAGSAEWYQRVLGFRLSDTIAFGPENGIFLHCNPRHHSIAFARIPEPPGLGHLMLEVDSLTAVGRAMDVVRTSPEPMVMTIGEHTNDLMTSFYVATPSGFLIEYGWNGRLVDDATWTVGHYETASSWGHQFQVPPGRPAGPPPDAAVPATVPAIVPA